MTALRALLTGSIDYAGLFPPAGLDMARATANYGSYRNGRTAWALGRFVVPVARLTEFEASRSALPARPGQPWRVSALLGSDPAADLRAVGEFNARDPEAVVIDVVEGKGDSDTAIGALLDGIPESLQAYVEIPVNTDPAALVKAVAQRRGRAKIRSGGVTPDAFPAAADVARFIDVCLQAGVPFKATAGLHHAMRGEYPLTYAPNSPRGTMFGFLNVFLASVLMAYGMDREKGTRLLEETSTFAIQISDVYIGWRGHQLDLGEVAAVRDRSIVSFGSCSFTEPIDDLTALGLI
jgi:hypothetical protein